MALQFAPDGRQLVYGRSLKREPVASDNVGDEWPVAFLDAPLIDEEQPAEGDQTEAAAETQQHEEESLTPEQQQQQQQKQKEAAAEYQRKLLQQKQAEEPLWKETVQALAEEEAAYKKTPEGEQAAAYEKKVLDGLAQTHPEHHAAMRRRLTPEQEHEHAELLALRRRTPEQERANAKTAAEITRIAARMDQASAADREPAKFPDGDVHWDYFDGQLIEQALQHTLLIDLEYPVLLGRHGGVLPCGLQHVPPAALITPANLWRVKLWGKRRSKGSVGVVVWSYPWLDWFHPDRNGAQLGRLLPFLESVLAEAKRDSPYCTVAVVIDYQCLFQKPFASEAEKRLFTRSLINVDLWYLHKDTYVVLVTPGPPEGAEHGVQPEEVRVGRVRGRRRDEVARRGESLRSSWPPTEPATAPATEPATEAATRAARR